MLRGASREAPRALRAYADRETLRASGPFSPSAGSNSTRAPSARVLKPSLVIALKWTNTSLPPSSGVMKPYPFASLNHFTVPVAILKTPPSEEVLSGKEARIGRATGTRSSASAGRTVAQNHGVMQLLAAPDKFRGTLTAREAAAAIAAGAERAGWAADELPLADGGEGTLDVLGGGNRRTLVSGPLGEPVEAAWRLEEDGTALIEAAQACGLTLAGGPERNDPLRATSRGVGELIAAAVAEGATRIGVTVRRVAATDGGIGATEAVPHPLHVPLEVACDVHPRFPDAAAVFAP